MPKFLHLKCLVCLALWVFKFYGFWSHFNFFVFIHFYWTIVALQCCVGFCSTARWISHRYACIPSLLDFCPIRVTTAHRAELPVQHSRFLFSCLLLFEEQVLSNPLEGLCRSSLTRGPSCSEWWGARYSLGDPQGPTTLPLSCGRIFSGKTPRPLNCHILSDTALGQLVSWRFWQVPRWPWCCWFGNHISENCSFRSKAFHHLCVCAQSCPALWDPMDCSSLGSSVYGISWARILEWIASSSVRGSSPHRDQTHISCIAGGFFTSGKLVSTSYQDRSQFSGLRKDLCNITSSQRDFQHLLASWPIITAASAKIPCPKFMNISSAAAWVSLLVPFWAFWD